MKVRFVFKDYLVDSMYSLKERGVGGNVVFKNK